MLAAGGIRIPIFRSGRIRADIEQADAALAQRKAEYEDLKGRAEQDVRVAVLDLAAASQLVKVCRFQSRTRCRYARSGAGPVPIRRRGYDRTCASPGIRSSGRAGLH